ncbi:MAG: DEAD/DEAH box helicase [Bacteroidales bacterium]|nr:DEAD/DEAH box helicase [Bacteroidales bacterium]
MNTKEILLHLGIDELNYMQEESLSVNRKKQNIILISPTGSGKTLAYLLPLVERIDVSKQEVQAVVIVPSRELAKQTQSVLQRMACGVRSEAVYGGRAAMDEHRVLKAHQPHIIIGTPGRLLDHLTKQNFEAMTVGNLIIDEFDKCLELGFQDEIQNVVKSLPNVSHRMLLSATDCPEIPRFIQLGNDTERIDCSDDEGQISDRIVLYAVKSPAKDKLDTLGLLLTQLRQQSSIIFVGFRESVDRITQYLKRQHFHVSDFHGGMDQDLRERALFRFSSGACNILVSTDLASRGLDIPEVDNIIHYHLPIDEASFVHRNGRTARWNASGNAYMIVGPEEHIPDFVEAEVQDCAIESKEVSPMAPKWESLYIGRGRKEKLSKGDIAGFMIKIGGLGRDEVGRIEVRDHCSYVSVLRSRVRELMIRIKGQRIKGMKTIIETTR